MKRYLTKKEIGDLGERLAVHYLRLRGYTVKERNWFADKCEIDIIAATLRDIVFVEVKTRTYEGDEWQSAPPPSLAVHAQKQQHTRSAAQRYLYAHSTRKQPRMDVIEVWLQKPPRENDQSCCASRTSRRHTEKENRVAAFTF